MNKVIFPKKIKAAAWIMMADGIIIPFSVIFYGIVNAVTENYGISIWEGILLIISMTISPILFFPFASFLFKKKKWAWKASVVLFFLFVSFVILFTIHVYFKYIECLETQTSMMQYEWFKGTKEQIKAGCMESYLISFGNLSSAIFFLPIVIVGNVVYYIFFFFNFPSFLFSQPLIFIGLFLFFLTLLIVLPLIFLFIDRKKYWKIAS